MIIRLVSVVLASIKNNLAIFFILLFVGVIPVGCDLFCLDDCGCGNTVVRDFSIMGLGLQTTSDTGTPLDTSVVYPYQEIFKLIAIADWQVVRAESPSALTFLNTAYACSPRDPQAVQGFQSIKIEALNSFTLNSANDEIKAGDDVTNRFGMSYFSTGTFVDVDLFIQEMRNIYLYDMFTIRLKEKPFQQVSMKLKFTIEMTDGSIYTFDEEILKAI